MTTAALTAVILASTLRLVSRPVDRPALADQYEKQCVTEAAAAGAPCRVLRSQLERALYEDLHALQSAGEPLERDVLRVGAGAESPLLASFCLDHLGQGLTAEEVPLVTAALDHPYADVRHTAAGILRSGANRPSKLLVRESREGRSSDSRPDEIPSAERLGTSIYPGASYRYFASSGKRAYFTTPDAPEKVVAFYTAKGGRTVTAAQLKELRQKPIQPDQAAMLKVMQSGGDVQKMIAEMQGAAAGQSVDWTAGVEGTEGVSAVRYVVVKERDLFGQKVPARVVAIYTDAALGATAVVHPLPQEAVPPADMERYLRIQMLLAGQ